MKNDQMNIKTYLGKFVCGDYDTSDVDTQIEAGWYDWFCRDTSLKAKTHKLSRKLMALIPSEKIDCENNYVFFKNNCPMTGNLYDDFRICDMETGDVIYTIVPSCGHSIRKGTALVYGKKNDFKFPLVEGTWDDVKEFFGVK